MQRRKHIVLIIALLLGLCGSNASAQRATGDTLRLPRREPHFSATTGFLGTGHGDNRLFTSLAPSVTFRPTARWAITGGLRLTSDFGLNGQYMAAPERNLAPVRNGGTSTASVYLEAGYQATDRLWLAASLYHLGGEYAPLFGPANGSTLDLSVTALSAEAAYRFGDNNYLHLSFTFVRDNTGALPYLWWENWHMGGWGGYGTCWNTWDRWNSWEQYNRWF